MMKQIPYGLTDFGRIQKENYYYVDKTMFIEKIEMQPSYLFLIRPRRFGKSLTLAMLEAYYDVRYADQFDELFGHLYIGQHPTPIHNQFLIMRFNFSEVSSNINEVEESFRLHCCGKLRHFLQKYEHILGKEIWNVLNEETLEEPGALLSAINSYATLKGDIKIYLLIDEYDNFTNTILSTYGTDLYRKATHGEGYIRRFFNVIKAATTGIHRLKSRLFSIRQNYMKGQSNEKLSRIPVPGLNSRTRSCRCGRASGRNRNSRSLFCPGKPSPPGIRNGRCPTDAPPLRPYGTPRPGRGPTRSNADAPTGSSPRRSGRTDRGTGRGAPTECSRSGPFRRPTR